VTNLIRQLADKARKEKSNSFAPLASFACPSEVRVGKAREHAGGREAEVNRPAFIDKLYLETISYS
jgi:hypothetical protein